MEILKKGSDLSDVARLFPGTQDSIDRVFVDDSPVEIEAVRAMLQEVTAIPYHRETMYGQFGCFHLKGRPVEREHAQRNVGNDQELLQKIEALKELMDRSRNLALKYRMKGVDGSPYRARLSDIWGQVILLHPVPALPETVQVCKQGVETCCNLSCSG